MNKLVVGLSLLITTHTCFSMEKFKEDFTTTDMYSYSEEFTIDGKKFVVTSYFDLSKHREVIETIFSNKNGMYDIRGLEMRFCNFAQTHMRRSRMIFFIAGIAAGAMGMFFLQEPTKRTFAKARRMIAKQRSEPEEVA